MSQGLQSQKEDFKMYLERTGAIQEISKVVVALYDEPERPSKTLNYMLSLLKVPETENVDILLKQFEAEQHENIRLRAEIAKIQKEIEEQKGL